MTVDAARELRNGQVCLVGVGPPNAAANLARRLHAPDCVLVYESGAIGARPPPAALDRRRRPRRHRPRARLGARDVQLLGRRRPHRRRLPRRRPDRPLRQHQHDRHRRLRRSPRCACRAPAARPRSRRAAGEVIVLLRHSTRAFVEELDFVTSVGRALDGRQRGAPRARRVITDLGVLRPGPGTASSSWSALHPGVELDEVREATGWPLRVREPLEDRAGDRARAASCARCGCRPRTTDACSTTDLKTDILGPMARQADAIIVGLGVIGSAIAFELSPRGLPHRLPVDKLPAAGYGPTSNSCSIVRAHYSTAEGVAMAWEDFAYWEDWDRYLGTVDDWAPARYMQCGTVLLEGATGHHATVRGLYRELGVAFEEWDNARLVREKVPGYPTDAFWPPKRPTTRTSGTTRSRELDGAIFTPGSGYVNDPATGHAQPAARRRGEGRRVHLPRGDRRDPPRRRPRSRRHPDHGNRSTRRSWSTSPGHTRS